MKFLLLLIFISETIWATSLKEFTQSYIKEKMSTNHYIQDIANLEAEEYYLNNQNYLKIENAGAQFAKKRNSLSASASYDDHMITGQMDQLQLPENVTTGDKYERSLSASYQKIIWNKSSPEDLELEKVAAMKLSKKADYEKAQLNACFAAVGIYTEVFYTREKIKVMMDVKHTAQKLHKVLKNQFQRHLITRMNLLSSEADLATLEVMVENTKSEQKQKQVVFEQYHKKEQNKTESLEDPYPLMHFTKNKDFADTLLFKKLTADSKALTASISSAHEATKQPIYGGLGVNYSNKEYTPYITLGLTYNFENPQFKRSTATFANERLKIQSSLLKAKRNFEEVQKQLSARHESFSNIQQTYEKRETILDMQINEAIKMVKDGKLELENYLSIRDRYLKSKLDILETKINIILTLSELKKTNEEKPEFCEVNH